MVDAVDVKEYRKRVSTVDAVQWDGSLNTAQEVIDWVLQQDSNATVNARFTSEGIRLEINTQGQVFLAGPNFFIVHGEDFGLATFTPEQFNQVYEVV